MADQGRIGDCWADQKLCFSLCLFKYMLKSILIIEINHTRHQKHFGRLSGPTFAGLHFGQLILGEKIKSMRK